MMVCTRDIGTGAFDPILESEGSGSRPLWVFSVPQGVDGVLQTLRHQHRDSPAGTGTLEDLS